MKYFKLVPLFLLFFFIGLVGCAHTVPPASPTMLSQDLKKVYDSGQALILYSYRDELVLSEAYADWETYLSNFRLEASKNYFYSKVTSEEFESVTFGATEFTLFLKKGYPVFLYEGFIVEPQVYTAISKKFSKKSLSDVDRAFMPEEIKVARK